MLDLSSGLDTACARFRKRFYKLFARTDGILNLPDELKVEFSLKNFPSFLVRDELQRTVGCSVLL